MHGQKTRNERKTWDCFVEKKYFDSRGCALSEIIPKHKNSKHGKFNHSE